MKQFISLLLLLIFIYSEKVTGQIAPAIPLKITPSELQASVNAGIDPYFVYSTDTVSTHGPKCIVRDLLQDKKGNIWLASWQGIICYDGKVFTNYTLKNDLIKFHVFSLFEDSKGNIWFGTARGGVYRYDGKYFTLFTTKDGLGDNSASCMAEDKDGNIWFCTSGGATRYDGKIFTNFTTANGLCSNDVHSILKDKTGKLWFGTKDGISCYDGKTFRNITNKGVPFEGVASLLEDKTGKIWIGTRKGLCCYKPSASLQADGKSFSDFLIPNFVMYMCEDKKGNLWLAHNNYPTNNNFVLYRYDGKSFNKIMEEHYSGAIFGIKEDNNGNIWAGTGLGVCRLDVLKTDNPCLKRTCKHDPPMRKAIEEHNKELERSCTYFRQ